MSEILTSPPVESAAETPVNPETKPDIAKLANLHSRAQAVGIGGELKIRWDKLRRQHSYKDAEKILNNEFAPRVLEAEASESFAESKATELRRQKLRVISDGVPVDRTATMRQTAQWVGNHLDVPPEKIEPASIPSRYAVAMLEMAGESRESREDFIYNKCPSMLRGKEESGPEQKGASEVDDDPSRTIIDDLLDKAQQSAARSAGESGVS
jgi:hypothetical protein